MKWILVSKKDLKTRTPYECADCKTKLPAGSYAKCFTFKKESNYLRKRICEDCEKYYRNKDLKI